MRDSADVAATGLNRVRDQCSPGHHRQHGSIGEQSFGVMFSDPARFRGARANRHARPSLDIRAIDNLECAPEHHRRGDEPFVWGRPCLGSMCGLAPAASKGDRFPRISPYLSRIPHVRRRGPPAHATAWFPSGTMLTFRRTRMGQIGPSRSSNPTAFVLETRSEPKAPGIPNWAAR